MKYRKAQPIDSAAIIEMRDKTKENPASPEQLAAMGITVDSWALAIRENAIVGYVCTDEQNMLGYCFGDCGTGEILVVAIRAEAENKGLGKQLMQLTTSELHTLGYKRLFLACNPDPMGRSHGFYRHLGWSSTNTFDENGDEILETFLD